MSFFRKWFGGGASSSSDRGFYVYVRPKACKEIVRIRINLENDLSLDEDGQGYFVRKTARAHRCPFAAEMTLHFSPNRQLVNQEITYGEFVSAEDYTAWAESQTG